MIKWEEFQPHHTTSPDYLHHLLLNLHARVCAMEGQTEMPKKRKRGKEKLDGFAYEVVELVRYLMRDWPKVRKDGSKVQNDDAAACQRIETILRSYADVSIVDLEIAATEWLETKPEYPNAIQFWFGPGKGQEPPWKIGVRAIRTGRK